MLHKKDLTIEQVNDLVVFLVANRVNKFKGMGLEMDLIPEVVMSSQPGQQEIHMTDRELHEHYNSRRI